MEKSPTITYGEFPHLFSGFPPDAPVNLEDRRTLATLRMFGDRQVVRALITEERLERLQAPVRAREEESRLFLRRLQDLGLADPDMAMPEGEG